MASNITSGDINNARLDNIKTFMRQYNLWRLNQNTSSPNRNAEDLILETPPVIIIERPNPALSPIPMEPGMLDEPPSLPTSESDQSLSDKSQHSDWYFTANQSLSDESQHSA